MPPNLPAEIVEVVVHALAPRHPHVHLHLLLDLDRRFDRPALEAALRGLVAAFPVLGSRYEPAFWRDRWVPWEGDLAARVHVEEVADVEAASRVWARRALEHTREPPVRLAFFGCGDGGRLVLTLHHMVADGGGVKAAAGALAALLAGVEPNPPSSADRRLMRVARALSLRDLPVLAVEFLREGLLPLSSLQVQRLRHGLSHGDGRPDPQWRTLTGGPAFAASCRAGGLTVNDGLVAAVALLASLRAEQGPVMVAYTVDLRRYLRESHALVTNLAGVSMVVLPRAATATADAARAAVHAAIGEQKRRLTGVSYALLPALAVGWWPHGLLRAVGRAILGQIMRRFDRAIAVTNIGTLDEALAPLGESVRAASITGPFIHGIPVPVVTATGFRGGLTLQVVATGRHSPEDLAAFSADLETAMADIQGATSSPPMPRPDP
ncbi:MAG: hypothetical protein ABIO70_07330 [Pseudomonadota bacterium]